MIFNCLSCGISISTRKETCTYCKADNSEIIEVLTGVPKFSPSREKLEWREKVKGTILSYVVR